MSNYTKATDFAAKDALLTGDANKVVKGTEIDDEFAAIQTAVNSKADSLSPALTGTPTAPTATLGTNTTQLATTAFVQAALQALYPVGSVYINASDDTSPSTLLGFGTWEAVGAGKVLVDQDTGDTSFDTLGETGGSKNAIVVSHTHSFSATTSSAGTHKHLAGHGHEFPKYGESGSGTSHQGASTEGQPYTSDAGAHTHTVSGTTGSSGSSGTNANLQPYVVVKMWKRTA